MELQAKIMQMEAQKDYMSSENYKDIVTQHLAQGNKCSIFENIQPKDYTGKLNIIEYISLQKIEQIVKV